MAVPTATAAMVKKTGATGATEATRLAMACRSAICCRVTCRLYPSPEERQGEALCTGAVLPICITLPLFAKKWLHCDKNRHGVRGRA